MIHALLLIASLARAEVAPMSVQTPASSTMTVVIAAGSNVVGAVNLNGSSGALAVTSTATTVTNAGTFAVQLAGTIGALAVTSTNTVLAAGSANVGSVNLSAMAGALNVVSTATAVTSLPALPAGSNIIGLVNINGTIGAHAVTSTNTILGAGTANIGSVNLSAMVGALNVVSTNVVLGAGSAVIGFVTSTYTVTVETTTPTFVYTSTVNVTDPLGGAPTASTGAALLTIMNGGSSSHVLKLRRLSATNYLNASVGIGGVASLGIVPITAVTNGTTFNIVSRKMDTNDNALDSNVTVTTGGFVTAASYTPIFSSLVALTTATIINDMPDSLFNQDYFGGKPLVLRPGEGFSVIRSSLPRVNLTGVIRVTAIFTQE